MIKLKYFQLGSVNFDNAVKKLMAAPLPIRAAYNVKKMVDKLEIARKKIGDEFHAVQEELNKLTESQPEGLDEEAKMKWSQEDHERRQKAQVSWGEKEIEIDRNRLEVADFAVVKFTVTDMIALEPIMNFDSLDAEKPSA